MPPSKRAVAWAVAQLQAELTANAPAIAAILDAPMPGEAVPEPAPWTCPDCHTVVVHEPTGTGHRRSRCIGANDRESMPITTVAEARAYIDRVVDDTARTAPVGAAAVAVRRRRARTVDDVIPSRLDALRRLVDAGYLTDARVVDGGTFEVTRPWALGPLVLPMTGEEVDRFLQGADAILETQAATVDAALGGN